ncbi:hypothetical protein [Paracidovorax wautersii]|uniref:Colicin import membrane protein n=1 Tax=Paracidovorax wautersii TaxID=1177982 RepID=A0ABU1IG77_9BURK|nr:hypothetical protein [Paracidovorax wautersii]MDR6216221.1 colicin import membrane protein [Paracidovorax wautersii]
MSSTTELIVLPPPETVREVFVKPLGLQPYLDQVREHLDTFVPDTSTKKGRDAIASIAYQVAKGKTAVDNLGKDLVAEMKKEPALVDAERKRWRDQMDAWKDEVRKPLTDWEEAEAAREAGHKAGIEWFQLRAKEHHDLDAAEIRASLAEVEAKTVDESWQEFEPEARSAKAKAVAALTAALTAREKYEAEQVELARLRQEAAAREQRDREEQIARDAAARAQLEAEAKAQADRDAATRREQELQQANERAEREKVEAQQREQQAVADAARRATEAVAAEQRRVAAQAEADAQEAKRREANKAHRQRINRAALDALVEGGLSEADAKTVITLIAKKAIPAVSITY